MENTEALKQRIRDLEDRVEELEGTTEGSDRIVKYGELSFTHLRTGDVVMYFPKGAECASAFYFGPNGNTCYLWDKPENIGTPRLAVYEPRRFCVRLATRDEARELLTRKREWKNRPKVMHQVPMYPHLTSGHELI
jgi:hypothetical protein